MKRMVCIDNEPHPNILKLGKHYLVSSYIEHDMAATQISNLDGITICYLSKTQFLFMFQSLEYWRNDRIEMITNG